MNMQYANKSRELLRILLSAIDLQKLSIYTYLQLVRKMVAIHSSKQWVCLCTVAAILFLISGGSFNVERCHGTIT